MNRAAEIARLLEVAVADFGDLAAVCDQLREDAGTQKAPPPEGSGAKFLSA